MAYFAPYIDESGCHIATFQDYIDYFVENARTIFGQDIYLENDSQDFQDIAARAKIAYDAALTFQYAYNSRGPGTAVGTGLDIILKLNGVRRNGATYSTALVNLTGTPFTEINNGAVSDVNGVFWNLPALVVLDGSGLASVTATCQVPGAVIATAGQINIIQTPTFGWASVTNPFSAAVGENQETDSQARARQSVSVANPSQALTTGILGGVLAVPNVVDARLYENDTNLTPDYIDEVYNPSGYPPHSITMVVDGGDGQTIANAIAVRKTPGCYTNGDQEYDTIDRFGVVTPIRFFLSEDVETNVTIYIQALTGYSSAIGDAIIAAVVARINGLNIGQSIVVSELAQAALNVDNGQYPLFSLTLIEAALDGETVVTDIVPVEFNQKAVTEADRINLIVT